MGSQGLPHYRLTYNHFMHDRHIEGKPPYLGLVRVPQASPQQWASLHPWQPLVRLAKWGYRRPQNHGQRADRVTAHPLCKATLTRRRSGLPRSGPALARRRTEAGSLAPCRTILQRVGGPTHSPGRRISVVDGFTPSWIHRQDVQLQEKTGGGRGLA